VAQSKDSILPRDRGNLRDTAVEAGVDAVNVLEIFDYG